MNVSYAYNNAVDVWDSAASYEDPTCIIDARATAAARCTRRKSAGSGIDNIFTNAKWLVKVVGPATRCRGTSTSRRSFNAARAIRSRRRS